MPARRPKQACAASAGSEPYRILDCHLPAILGSTAPLQKPASRKFPLAASGFHGPSKKVLPYIQVAAIDPAIKNCAIRIEKRFFCPETGRLIQSQTVLMKKIDFTKHAPIQITEDMVDRDTFCSPRFQKMLRLQKSFDCMPLEMMTSPPFSKTEICADEQIGKKRKRNPVEENGAHDDDALPSSKISKKEAAATLALTKKAARKGVVVPSHESDRIFYAPASSCTDITEIFQPQQTLTNIFRHLVFLDSLLVECHYIVVEQQMSFNPSVAAVEKCILGVLQCIVANHGVRPMIVLAHASLKSSTFEDVIPKMKKPELKKWCAAKACALLKQHSEPEIANRLAAMTKDDDLGDVVCYTEAWFNILDNNGVVVTTTTSSRKISSCTGGSSSKAKHHTPTDALFVRGKKCLTVVGSCEK